MNAFFVLWSIKLISNSIIPVIRKNILLLDKKPTVKDAKPANENKGAQTQAHKPSPEITAPMLPNNVDIAPVNTNIFCFFILLLWP